MYEIIIYQTDNGKEPFTAWKEKLDKSIGARIEARLTRLRSTGNLGDYKSLKDGIFEIKLDFGSGLEFILEVEKKIKK